MVNTQFHANRFAAVVGISKQRTTQLIAFGKLRPINMGRTVLIDIQDPVNIAWVKGRPDAAAVWTRLTGEAGWKSSEAATSLSVGAPAEDEEDEIEEPIYDESRVHNLMLSCFAEGKVVIGWLVDDESSKTIIRDLVRTARKAKSEGAAITATRKRLRSEVQLLKNSLDHIAWEWLEGFPDDKDGSLARRMDELLGPDPGVSVAEPLVTSPEIDAALAAAEKESAE